jgi:muramoyltetrapeptide carboxypeptidase
VLSSNISRAKPPALRPGDLIGIVAPASNIKRDNLEAGCDALARLGYRTTYADSIFDRDLYFAGSVERRVRELEEMFERDDIRAIVAARGGYGANYLLPKIDLAKIKAHPKIFVGYSDLTALLTYFTDAGNLITFHGPMAAKDWSHADGVDLASWHSALAGVGPWELSFSADSGVRGLVDGEAQGILYGGCLSILTAALGTPYDIRTEGAILFLEDVAARPYQIDRMLMQLKLAGKFRGVRGIVFGEMLDCRQSASQDYTLEEVVMRIVGDLGIPVAYGVRSGHVTSGNVTLPIGVEASLSVSGGNVDLKILEGAVTA